MLKAKRIFSYALLVNCSLIFASAGCKHHVVQTASVKGLNAAAAIAQGKDLDYNQLLDSHGDQPVKFSFFFTYEEFNHKEVATPGTSDTAPGAAASSSIDNEGTRQAKLMVEKLDNTPGITLVGQHFPTEVITPSDTIYTTSYQGTLTPSSEGKASSFVVEIVLGRALEVGDGTQEAVALDSFLKLVARAMSHSDIVMYNGHIWESGPATAVATDKLTGSFANTGKLLQMLVAEGERQTLGLMFMNVCKSEAIELQLMSQLNKDKVVLLSNRYFNNYGYHALQSEVLLDDILKRTSLPTLMVHLMGDLRYRLTDPKALEDPSNPFIDEEKWGADRQKIAANQPWATLPADVKRFIEGYGGAINLPDTNPTGAIPLEDATVVVVRDGDNHDAAAIIE